jgi:hypothetical protein
MSYTFLLEQGEESSAEYFLGIPAFVLSKSSRIAGKSSCNANETESYPSSPFGTTSKHSTPDLGEDEWAWCAEGSHAKTLAPPEKAKELAENDLDCGPKCLGAFARFNPNTSSWKTAQCSLLGGLIEFSETWPRWGMMRYGECWVLATPERHTNASEFGYLPTIRASDADRGGRGDLIQAVRGNPNSHYSLFQTPVSDDAPDRKAGKINSRGEPKLSAQVKLFPTTTAHDHKDSGLNPSRVNRNSMTLPEAARLIPTPRAFMHKDSTTDRGKSNLGEIIGGALNPPWVEWLMGWPIEWTALRPLETDKFQSWLRSHGDYLADRNPDRLKRSG